MQWRIPLFEPNLGEAEITALTRVIESGWLTQGERTEAFEQAFAEFVGCRHAVALNSATAALHLALLSLGVGPGDEVICPSLTFVATANAIRYCGATPVFADITSLEDWNIAPDAVAACVTARTKAIIVVHYAGYLCDMKAINVLAARHGIAVIEDVAHAPGAHLDGRGAGAWGRAGCFSFFSNKNMTTAEGGMLTTDDEDIFQAARRLRCHGMTSVTLDRHKGHNFSYDVTALGFNYRMSELNAALGMVQLAELPRRNAARAAVVGRYRETLALLGDVQVPFPAPVGQPAYHIMPVLLPEGMVRSEVMAALRDRGVQTSIHYRPVHSFSNYEALAPAAGKLPLTDIVGERGLTLPLYPDLSGAQVEFVCESLHDVLAG